MLVTYAAAIVIYKQNEITTIIYVFNFIFYYFIKFSIIFISIYLRNHTYIILTIIHLICTEIQKQNKYVIIKVHTSFGIYKSNYFAWYFKLWWPAPVTYAWIQVRCTCSLKRLDIFTIYIHDYERKHKWKVSTFILKSRHTCYTIYSFSFN